MSAQPQHNQRIVKTKGEIGRQKQSMYKSSFGDLDDGTIYRDPAGWKTPNGAELQKARWEQLANEPVAELGGQSVVGKWNELQQKGFSLEESTREIAKSLDTGDWTLPLDIIPEVFVVNPGVTPMADMMTRVTTQDDEVVATPIDADPEPTFGLEGTATTDDEGNRQYEYEQPTYDDLRYDVLGVGMATRLSDKLILSSQNLRNAESAQEQSLVRGMRKKMESQIIHGTNATQGGDANGFDGFNDIGTTIDDLGDPADTNVTPELVEETTRELIDTVEFNGAPRNDIAVVCDFEWHRRLRESITDNVRYNDPDSEIMAGFSTLTFDDVPVFKSDQMDRLSDIPSTETRDAVYAVNMNATYLSMLRETSVQPLARIGPQERFAVDAYGTLTAEAPEHIRSYSVTAP